MLKTGGQGFLRLQVLRGLELLLLQPGDILLQRLNYPAKKTLVSKGFHKIQVSYTLHQNIYSVQCTFITKTQKLYPDLFLPHGIGSRYCMSKKQSPILYTKLLYKMGNYFLGRRYNPRSDYLNSLIKSSKLSSLLIRSRPGSQIFF